MTVQVLSIKNPEPCPNPVSINTVLLRAFSMGLRGGWVFKSSAVIPETGSLELLFFEACVDSFIGAPAYAAGSVDTTVESEDGGAGGCWGSLSEHALNVKPARINPTRFKKRYFT